MSAAIYLEHHQDKDAFQIRFYNTNITICIHQVMTLLSNIQANDSRLIDLGLLWSVDGWSFEYLQRKPTYRLCLGQTILLLSERDMVELMAQLWDSNPMLMHWVVSEEQECS